MIKALISDFSRVLLFPKDENYKGSLNGLHRELSKNPRYKILDHFQLNFQLLDFYKLLSKKIDLYIFTTETIQDSLDLQSFLKPVFKGIYSALKMGITKGDKKAYLKLAKIIGFEPNEIIYVDDRNENVEMAKSTGFIGIQFKDNECLKSEVELRLNIRN